MKRKIEFDEVPKGKDNVVQYLTRYCKSRDIEISFDDANGNFGNTRNQSVCACGIECSVFNEGDDDLLLFSVFHELGHMRGVGSTTKFKMELGHRQLYDDIRREHHRPTGEVYA